MLKEEIGMCSQGRDGSIKTWQVNAAGELDDG